MSELCLLFRYCEIIWCKHGVLNLRANLRIRWLKFAACKIDIDQRCYGQNIFVPSFFASTDTCSNMNLFNGNLFEMPCQRWRSKLDYSCTFHFILLPFGVLAILRNWRNVGVKVSGDTELWRLWDDPHSQPCVLQVEACTTPHHTFSCNRSFTLSNILVVFALTMLMS